MTGVTSDMAIAVCLLIGGAGYLGLAWYVWKQRRRPGAWSLFSSLIAVFIWTTAYAIEMTTRTPQAGAVWSTVKYFGIVLLAPSLLAFIVEYTGRGRHLTPKAMRLLAIEPLIVMTLLIVPATHDLMLIYEPERRAGADLWWIPKAGPLFWPHAVYSYALLVGTLGLLVSRLLRLAQPYRRPAYLITVTSVLPLVGNVFYNLDLTYVDPTPFLFILLSVVLVWGFFTMGLIDLVPIARGRVVEQMTDAVLVLDVYNRVLDVNPAACRLLGLPRGSVVGRYANVTLPALEPILIASRAGAPAQAELELPGDQFGNRDDSVVHLDVQLTTMTDRADKVAGRLLVMRDVTARTETERRLRHLLESETQLATVLQTSLRPARLPTVPRVRLAARSLPGADGAHVSGDFYDVHQTLGDDWAFVIGDVAGKGVQAAVITSMVRYTVRTLSAQGWSPKQVIEQLNQALLAETASDRFCTLAYCRIAEADPDDAGQVRAGVRLTIALGGHPAPLVRRVTGEVEAIGRSGTALGIVASVDIEEVTIDLSPGEVLVAFTDGVTEARRDDVEFGEERLAWTMSTTAAGLTGLTGPAAATLLADAVADRVMQAVTEYSQHRDDIAVLVVSVS